MTDVLYNSGRGRERAGRFQAVPEHSRASTTWQLQALQQQGFTFLSNAEHNSLSHITSACQKCTHTIGPEVFVHEQ